MLNKATKATNEAVQTAFDVSGIFTRRSHYKGWQYAYDGHNKLVLAKVIFPFNVIVTFFWKIRSKDFDETMSQIVPPWYKHQIRVTMPQFRLMLMDFAQASNLSQGPKSVVDPLNKQRGTQNFGRHASERQGNTEGSATDLNTRMRNLNLEHAGS